MFELQSEVFRLEMRCWQRIIHLRTTDRNSADAHLRRAGLYTMLTELTALKGRRQELEEALELQEAA